MLISGGLGLFNLRPLLGTEYVRPMLNDVDSPLDLTFRGDVLGDAVLAATKEMDSQRDEQEQGERQWVYMAGTHAVDQRDRQMNSLGNLINVS